MGKIATEKYWFGLIGRTDYPHGGEGEHCPTKEQILTVPEYNNYTLDQSLLSRYANNQLCEETDVVYNSANVPISIKSYYHPLPDCGSFPQRLTYCHLRIIINNHITYHEFQTINCGTGTTSDTFTLWTFSDLETSNYSVKYHFTLRPNEDPTIFPESEWHDPYRINILSSKELVININDPSYDPDPGPASFYYAYLRVPTSGCTGIIEYTLNVNYTWNDVDGNKYPTESWTETGTITADGSTHMILLGSGSFTAGENYWYSGSFISNCKTFNYYVMVDGMSSDGNYYG